MIKKRFLQVIDTPKKPKTYTLLLACAKAHKYNANRRMQSALTSWQISLDSATLETPLKNQWKLKVFRRQRPWCPPEATPVCQWHCPWCQIGLMGTTIDRLWSTSYNANWPLSCLAFAWHHKLHCAHTATTAHCQQTCKFQSVACVIYGLYGWWWSSPTGQIITNFNSLLEHKVSSLSWAKEV